VDSASLDVGQSLSELGIDDAALLWRVFVVRGGKFRIDADDTAGDLEFDLLAALKTSLPTDGRRNHKRRSVFHGDGHGR
jgi:hypothetical protein